MANVKFTAAISHSSLPVTSFFDGYFKTGNKRYTCHVFNKKTKNEFEQTEIEGNKLLNTIKVITYFTLITPVLMFIGKCCTRLYHKGDFELAVAETSSKTEAAGQQVFQKNSAPTTPTNRILKPADEAHKEKPIPIIKEVYKYPVVLTNEERKALTETSKKIRNTSKESPNLDMMIDRLGLTIRISKKGIFDSEAEVVVNAGNRTITKKTVSGVNDLILTAGGGKYVKEQTENLPKAYKSKTFTEGHAAMLSFKDTKTICKADSVIFVVGPDYRTLNEKKEGHRLADFIDQLYSTYLNSLILANQEGKKSIAFASVSTGIFQFPPKLAAKIFFQAVEDYTKKTRDSNLKIFMNFIDKDKEVADIFKEAAGSLDPSTPATSSSSSSSSSV